MRYAGIRTVFESFAPRGASQEERLGGTGQFLANFRAGLGLAYNEFGRPVLDPSKRKWSHHEFSLRGLAEALCGYEWVERLQQPAHAGAGMVVESGPGNVAVTPGNFPEVSAYLGSISGLLEAAVLEAYQKPEYIIDSLVEVVPSKTRQRNLIGTGRIGNQAMRRNPGDPHPFAQFGQRKVRTTETYNEALAGAVTFEAVYFDQTGEVLDRMNSIGDELGLSKELDGFRMIAGVTNPYNYNGTAYNTYLTSGNWVNDVASNELVDWTNINTVNALFSRMTDQETGNRIAVEWDTQIVSPNKEETANYIQSATEVEQRTQTAAEIRRGSNRVKAKRIVKSVYLDQILTTAAADGGLALSQTNADKYWWALKTGRGGAFIRTENWGLQINKAAPNDFDMLNHKLLLAIFADQMHSFDVREPRYVVRSKN